MVQADFEHLGVQPIGESLLVSWRHKVVATDAIKMDSFP